MGAGPVAGAGACGAGRRRRGRRGLVDGCAHGSGSGSGSSRGTPGPCAAAPAREPDRRSEQREQRAALRRATGGPRRAPPSGRPVAAPAARGSKLPSMKLGRARRGRRWTAPGRGSTARPRRSSGMNVRRARTVNPCSSMVFCAFAGSSAFRLPLPSWRAELAPHVAGRALEVAHPEVDDLAGRGRDVPRRRPPPPAPRRNRPGRPLSRTRSGRGRSPGRRP